MEEPADAAARRLPGVPPVQVDEARRAAAGIRKLDGRRLALYTDLPSDPEVDTLPAAFDQAFSRWCDYFGVDEAAQADWHARGFVIGDRAKFRELGLLPPDLPPFQHAYARNFEFWVYEQPSGYYRRHLVLHEGVHCFMNTLFGACGPPWYMEGMAELLSPHRWRDGRLEVPYFPKNRDEVPMLGRIKIVQEGVAAGRAMSLGGVLDYGPHAHLQTEPYAWCWALCALLDGDPRFRERFRRLNRNLLRPDFTERFLESLGEERTTLDRQWQVFVSDIDYGYDVARSAVDFSSGLVPSDGGATVRVAADRGWQNSGVRLEGGRTYRLRASGRYQVVDGPKPWISEPGGVTLRYHRGRPLGLLLGAVLPEGPASDASALATPIEVGLGTEITPRQSGTLYLRVNDSAAELGDNRGEVRVEIVPQ